MNQTDSMDRDTANRLKRVRRLARLLDSSIRVPLTDYRIGVESLIGLIPGVGDVAGAALSGYLIWQAHKAGAPGRLKAKFVGYVLLEMVVGAVPLLGDLFDFAFKANLRIAEGLDRHLASRPEA